MKVCDLISYFYLIIKKEEEKREENRRKYMTPLCRWGPLDENEWYERL
jgi:hypothetical protein